MEFVGQKCNFMIYTIFQVCEWHVTHKERILAIFFLVLEIISVVLDQIGKDKKSYLLAAFILSAFGFCMTLYSLIHSRTNPTLTSTSDSDTQLQVVEVVFALIQLIVTFVQYILTALKVKNDYNGSVFPLAFAVIAVCFIFIKDDKISHSLPHRQQHWPLPNVPVDSEPIRESPKHLVKKVSPVLALDFVIFIYWY